MAEHTRLPWFQVGLRVFARIAPDEKGHGEPAMVARVTADHNTAFIVKACNNYHDLMKARAELTAGLHYAAVQLRDLCELTLHDDLAADIMPLVKRYEQVLERHKAAIRETEPK